MPYTGQLDKLCNVHNHNNHSKTVEHKKDDGGKKTINIFHWGIPQLKSNLVQHIDIVQVNNTENSPTPLSTQAYTRIVAVFAAILRCEFANYVVIPLNILIHICTYV